MRTCPHCQREIPERNSPKRLSTGARFLGVCGGIADHFGWDRLWVRLAFVILAFCTFSVAIIGYFIAALLMEQQPPCTYEHCELR